MANIGEDRAAHGGLQCVGVRLHIGAGSHAEEAVLRVDGIQAAVRALADPGDIVANGPDLVALLLIAFRRNQHSQIGLAASRRESSTQVFDLA